MNSVFRMDVCLMIDTVCPALGMVELCCLHFELGGPLILHRQKGPKRQKGFGKAAWDFQGFLQKVVREAISSAMGTTSN